MLTLNPDSWKFIIASEMLTSSGKITFSALNGPAKRSDKLRIESEIVKIIKFLQSHVSSKIKIILRDTI